jgi:sterol desaturase/sphingolipid hydroxylase (fatty acid hydroxylase superfamily)
MFVETLVTVSSLTISASLAFLFSSFYLFMDRLKSEKGVKAYKIITYVIVFLTLISGIIIMIALAVLDFWKEYGSPLPDALSLLTMTGISILGGSAGGMFTSFLWFIIIRTVEKIIIKK